MSHFAFLHSDAQAAADGMMTRSEHPSFGGRTGGTRRCSDSPDTPGRAKPFCEKGEHTRRILAELGFDDERDDRLKKGDVITWPAEQSETAMALS